MKHLLFAVLVACTLLAACSSNDKATQTKKTRSASAERLPAEDK